MRRALYILAGIVMAPALAVPSLQANPEDGLLFVSPDGRYGVRIGKTADTEGITRMAAELEEVESGEPLCELETPGNQWATGIRLLWSPDSRRFAFVSPSRRGDWTSLWVLENGSFEQVAMPRMPALDLKRGHDTKTVLASRSAVRWTKPDVLLMDLASEDDEGNSATLRVALHFGGDGGVKVMRVGGNAH